MHDFLIVNIIANIADTDCLRYYTYTK